MISPARESRAAGASLRYLEAFLEMLVAERGASGNTLDAYRRDLLGFLGHAGQRGKDFLTADADVLRHYMQAQAKAGMSARTAARRLSALRQLFQFMFAEGFRPDNPALAIDRPKQRQPLPKFLSEDEVDRLLAAATARSGWDRLRVIALLEILYATGLRVSELVGLPLSALGRDGKTLIVRGKGGKERMLPLTEPASDALADYLGVREHFMPAKVKGREASPWLFPSRSRQGHLTRVRFGQMLKELAASAGIEAGRVSPHVLRHSFASHLLAHGADLRSLQQLLGHADIGTTQIYTHVLDARLEALVQQAHPLARLDRSPAGRGE